MKTRSEQGFSLIELMIASIILLLAMTGLATLLIQNARINKSQQMHADVQAQARNTLEMVVQKLRSAGWDPMNQGIATVTLDPDGLADNISEIEVFADLDEDGLTTSTDEQMLIRHIANRVEWRRTPGGSFQVLASNISNDSDGDGNAELMFVPDATPDPEVITVRITAQSPVVDPVTRDFIRYTVEADVIFRKEL